jgi:hypothetical protein
MSAEKLNLQCATCGSSTDRAQARSLMPWAELEACCNVDWLDEGTALPNHDIWTRSSTMPLTGHRQHVKLYHPFAAAIGESFWLMFMPGAAALNGWAEAPQTIITSAFVHCHLDEIIRRAESWAWVLVAIDDVVSIPKLGRRFPNQIGPVPDAELHQTLVRTRFRDWDLIEGSSEGDVGAWFLARRSQQKIHLVGAGRWSFHEDVACAGNLEITNEQWKRLCLGMGVS